MTVYRMISAEKASTPVSVCCRLLGVSRSGYYEWASRAPSDRALADAWLIEKIRQIHGENRHVYGSPRIHADLRLAHGIHVSRKRVQRLMREAGISGLVARKRGRTTIRVPGVRVADDLVERRFRPETPNVLWIADITCLRTWEGWLYLAAVQDAYSRRIVGWSMADHMRTELVVDALQTAVARRRPKPGLIFHSGRRRGTLAEISPVCHGLDRAPRHRMFGCASLRRMAHEVISTPRLQAALDRIRPVIEALPGAFEKLSHGSPTFFVGEGRKARTFASLHDEREWGEGRLCLWLAAPEGMQEGVVAGDPVRWFVPPYVGHRGWVGLRLDLPDTDWEDAEGALEDAHALMADRVR